MRHIESVSAALFFVAIHIPLSRVSSLFSLITAVVPLILDKKIKENIYLKTNRVATRLSFSRNDPAMVTDIIRKSSEVSKKMKQLKY